MEFMLSRTLETACSIHTDAHPSLCTAAHFAAGALILVGNVGSPIRNTMLSCRPSTPITVGTTAIVFGWSESGGIVTAPYAHAEGPFSTASGYVSHAEGFGSDASGTYGHAEGSGTTASGYFSHAEGASTTASGYISHAEGFTTTASGHYSHAEGGFTTASGIYSHAGGSVSVAALRGQWARSAGNFAAAGDANNRASFCLEQRIIPR